MSEIKSELQTYTPVRGMLICQNGTGYYISKTEAEERLAKELQAVKDKAIEAYKANCRIYTPCCLDKHPCTANCEYLADFTAKLNEL